MNLGEGPIRSAISPDVSWLVAVLVIGAEFALFWWLS